MADELKRVGLVFKADGAADFQKTMQQVNTAVQENSNSFKLAKAAWDDSTTAVEKLKDRQEYLAKQTDVYSDKVEILKRELEEMESAENRNEDAIRKKHKNDIHTCSNNPLLCHVHFSYFSLLQVLQSWLIWFRFWFWFWHWFRFYIYTSVTRQNKSIFLFFIKCSKLFILTKNTSFLCK